MITRPDLGDLLWVPIPDLASVALEMPATLASRPGARLVRLTEALVTAAAGEDAHAASSAVWVHPRDAKRILAWLGECGSGRCGPEAIRLLTIWMDEGYSEWEKIPPGFVGIDPAAISRP